MLRLIRERQAEHPDAQAVGVSRQTAGILDKVADANGYLLDCPADQAWMIEAHPEVTSPRLNAGSPLAPKSTARGLLERLALIDREFPQATDDLR